MPNPLETKETTRTSLDIDSTLHGKFKSKAARDHISMNAAMAALIGEYVREERELPAPDPFPDATEEEREALEACLAILRDEHRRGYLRFLVSEFQTERKKTRGLENVE